MKWVKNYWWVWVLAVPLLAVGGFVGWALDTADPMPEALAALESDSQVTVADGRWLVFRPVGEAHPSGLIFYPGGKVDYRAYAPVMRALAEEGYTAVIVPMPLNLAVFAPDAAGDVIAAMPEITAWVVGGHSLGGSMAAHFAYGHSSAVRGLVLWASYPASNEDLSAYNLELVSIFGERDGLATAEKIEASRALLPAATRWVPIAGGNHAQFGWYGPQAGDNPAAISRAEQQQQVVAATVDLLKRVSAP